MKPSAPATQPSACAKQADEAREAAEVNQRRAEGNLQVALKAFDAIFDNVARRGVPQSLSFDINDESANASATAGEESPQIRNRLHDSNQR